MKLLCKIFAALSLCILSLFFASCLSADVIDPESVEPGDYIGLYDETMTPENSCVIMFYFPENEFANFKQINPEFKADQQYFDYKGGFLGISPNWTIFKPCKPGSKYMLTKFKGHCKVGNIVYRWDMDLSIGQQYFVIDVPKKPGIYAYTLDKTYYISGERVAAFAQDGRVYPLAAPNGKASVSLYKYIAKDFAKHYGKTPWYDAFLKTRESIIATNQKAK